MSDRFQEIKIKGATVFLTSDEIHKLLLSDTNLFAEALKRGKGITRQRQKERQYERKWAAYEGEKLDHIE